MSNKRIDQFESQSSIGGDDKVPFWKHIGGVTSYITWVQFLSSIVSAIFLQGKGQATNKVMSQKAVTDELDALEQDVSGLNQEVQGLEQTVDQNKQDTDAEINAINQDLLAQGQDIAALETGKEPSFSKNTAFNRPFSSQPQAETGTNEDTVMNPLRVSQRITAWWDSILTSSTAIIANIFHFNLIRLIPGTTAQRPNDPLPGMVRYNSTTVRFEFYSGGAWRNFPRLEGDTFTGQVTVPSFRVTALAGSTERIPTIDMDGNFSGWLDIAPMEIFNPDAREALKTPANWAGLKWLGGDVLEVYGLTQGQFWKNQNSGIKYLMLDSLTPTRSYEEIELYATSVNEQFVSLHLANEDYLDFDEETDDIIFDFYLAGETSTNIRQVLTGIIRVSEGGGLFYQSQSPAWEGSAFASIYSVDVIDKKIHIIVSSPDDVTCTYVATLRRKKEVWNE